MAGFWVRPLLAWYEWAVYLLLFVDVGMLALIAFDSLAHRQPASGWMGAALLPLLCLVPSLWLAIGNPALDDLVLSPGLDPAFGRQLVTWFLVGLAGGLVPVGAGLLYLHALLRKRELGNDRAVHSPSGEEPEGAAEPLPAGRPLANAWLVDRVGGRTYPLYQGDTRIGRSSAIKDVVLDDPAVSREHLLVRQSGGQFTLFDRGSHTGTFVNGERVLGPVLLVHGDLVRLGDTSLQFVAAE